MKQAAQPLIHLSDFSEMIHCSGYPIFCAKIEDIFQAKPQLEYSRCSWERGWNLKYKKSGKTLCTIYPRENYFTVLVVLNCTDPALSNKIPENLKNVFNQTFEGNHQRWMMIDLEEDGLLLNDVIQLIQLRRSMLHDKQTL